MKKILLLLLSVSCLFAYQNRYNRDQVITDFKAGDTEKYTVDNLVQLDVQTLIEKGIIGSASDINSTLTSAEMIASNKSNIIPSKLACVAKGIYTASIYEVNPKTGVVKCMVSKKGDLFNPIGYYEMYHEELKNYFFKDLDKAQSVNADLIKSSQDKFSVLYNTKKEIQESTISNASSNYLNISELLLALILTDDSIIDVEAMSDTGSLQLKENFTSKVFGKDGIFENSDLVLMDGTTIFSVYTKLSDSAMFYLVILLVFFGLTGSIGFFARPLMDKAENLQNQDKKIPYALGLVAGVILFIPIGQTTLVSKDANNQVTNQYEVMHTNYQYFERQGYYIFLDWAHEVTDIVIDEELNSIIKKSGVSNTDMIINSYAGQEQYQKLTNFATAFSNQCSTIYNDTLLKDEDLSRDKNNPYPVSENWAFAKTYSRSDTPKYYYPLSEGGFVQISANGLSTEEAKKLYPPITLSACGKMYYNKVAYQSKLTDYQKSYEQSTLPIDNQKLKTLQALFKFQYALRRDWGILSVLALPVVKMQTEYIGGLYKTQNSQVIEKLNEDIAKDSAGGFTHMVLSSIPYLFVPGAGTVYKVTADNGGKLGFLAGGGGGAPTGFGAIVTAILGGVIGSVTGSAAGVWMAYHASKTILVLAPIIGILVLGIARFGIIMVKIFLFHFGSLFMMPIIFVKENWEAMKRFTMKIFATMVELPLYPLSIWIAIMANSIIHSIGDVFGKKIILGMLENNALAKPLTANMVGYSGEWLDKLKIYLFDGFIEMSISVFAIIIIYKIIMSLHTTLLEVFEIQSSNVLDATLESIKGEANGWGSRI